MSAVLEFVTKTIQSGDYNNSSTVSLFGTPGSGGIIAGYYECNIVLGVALCEDMSLWLAPMGGTVAAHYKVGVNRRKWTPILYAYPEQFYAYWAVESPGVVHYLGPGQNSPGETHIYASTVFSGCESSSQEGEDPGPVSYTMYNYGAATVGQEPPAGYVQVNANLKEQGINPTSHTVWTWLSGAVSYGTPDTDDVWMPSQKIEIEGLTKLFDYYPWARDINSNGVFYSLNRDGSSQDSTGLHRYDSSNWTRVLNTYSDDITEDDHGFRYNNGWKKSPESGEGI